MKLTGGSSRIAFAVGDLDEARHFFEDTLGAEFDEVEDVREFQFRYQPFRLGGAEMQLMSAYAPESVIAHYVMKHGPGFHHLTLEVDDLDAVVRELEAKNVRIASRHRYEEPHEGQHWKDAFIHPRDAFGVLVQLVERA